MSSTVSPDDVVIVLPVYRDHLLPDEKFAVRHLFEYLDRYPIFRVSPAGLPAPPELRATPVQSFPSTYFEGISGYNRLLLSRNFYERFSDFAYLLIYQLDALVFSDQLLHFCEMNWDYIGPPWFRSEYDPSRGFTRSGNGGFSLRKIDSFLRVLETPLYRQSNGLLNFFKIWRTPFEAFGSGEENLIVRQLKRINVARKARHGVQAYVNTFKWNEDRFWANHAEIFDSSFRVAPVKVGLQFAFEKFPEYCLKVNQGDLPFGCHAWYRYNRSFWEPFLHHG